MKPRCFSTVPKCVWAGALPLLWLAGNPAWAADPSCLAKRPGLLGYAESFRGTPIGIEVKGNYAYVGDWGRYTWGVIQAFDITDPCNPVRRGMAETVIPGRNEIGDVALVGSHVYLANDANGVTVYDVSNPNVPFLPLLARRTGDATYSHAAAYDGARYLFVGNMRSFGRALLVYDTASFPASAPAIYAPNPNDEVFAIHLRGDRAYLFTAGATFGLQIVNIANPMAPSHVATLLLPPGVYGDVGELRALGNYVYVFQRDYLSLRGGLRVVDISNEAAPAVVARLDVPDIGGMDWKGPGIEIAGNYAYVCTRSGLNVIDIANPLAPALVRTFPLPAAFGNAVAARVKIVGPLAYVTVYNLDLPSQKGGLAIYKLNDGSLVDSNVSLVSQSGARETAGACAPGQVFRVNATWRNNGVPLINLYAKASVLTNGELITNSVSQTSDGVVATNEQSTGLFRIQLAACNSFQFRVSLYGFPLGQAPGFRRGGGTETTETGRAEHLGDFVFDLGGELRF